MEQYTSMKITQAIIQVHLASEEIDKLVSYINECMNDHTDLNRSKVAEHSVYVQMFLNRATSLLDRRYVKDDE